MSEIENNDQDIVENVLDRNKKIIKTSLVAIITNMVLAGFKATVGYLANSIAISLDALNNFTDALSSIITIVGTKLANKNPDKKHPFGYGRVEYFSTFIIAALVLYAGISAMVGSIKKLMNPVTATYSKLSLTVIAVAVVVKFLLGKYVQKKGESAHSSALLASGKDSLFDSLLSFFVFLTAIIFIKTGLSLESYMGIIISVIIIKSALEMMGETVDDMLGHRIDSKTSKKLKEIIGKEKDVLGVYDVIVYNYGPNRNYASAHVELADTLTVNDVDVLSRQIEIDVYRQTGIIMTGIGVYSHNTRDKKIVQIREDIKNITHKYDRIVQFHGFYADTEKKIIRYDVVINFEIDAIKAMDILKTETKKLYPDYQISITPDIDFSAD